MSLADDIKSECATIFKSAWSITEGRVVPTTEDVGLGNKGVKLDAVVLYADMADSTGLVMSKTPEFAAEIYKAYLQTCVRIIKAEGGDVTAFDGDRVMAVFIGESKNSSAAIAALKINYAIPELVNTQLKSCYPNSSYKVEFTIGIDSSSLLVARTGIRGTNDLVWVGNSANLAAKLCQEGSPSKRIWITERVFDKLNKDAKYGNNGSLMWDLHTWTDYGINVYGSNWRYNFV